MRDSVTARRSLRWRSSWAGRARMPDLLFSARMGRTKSCSITVAMELMPESMLDMAAAKMALMMRPEKPAGRRVMM